MILESLLILCMDSQWFNSVYNQEDTDSDKLLKGYSVRFILNLTSFNGAMQL